MLTIRLLIYEAIFALVLGVPLRAKLKISKYRNAVNFKTNI